MKAFPLFLTVENKTIVVFGGGADAAAKLRLVQKTCASVLVVAEELDKNLLQLGNAKWIACSPLEFSYPDNTAFVFAATGNRELDRSLAEKARAAGVTVCAVDQPNVSDFTTPAIVDRDPVIVAIGTEGTAPVLSRQIKANLETELEFSLGLIARTANQLRPWAAQTFLPGKARRDFWSKFFTKARQENLTSAQAAKNLALRISAKQSSEVDGRVQFIAVHHQDPDLLTVKAQKTLDRASVVFHDGGIAQSILELARREAHIVGGSIVDRKELVFEAASTGKLVTILHSTNCRNEKLFLDNLGIQTEIIPSVPSAQVASLTSNLPTSDQKKAA